MKLSLVKAAVAGATAASVAFAGAGIASAADTNTDADFSSEFFGSSTSDGEEVTPALIREYISIFTSIINALDTAFAFAAK